MDTCSANARAGSTILLLSGTSEGPLLACALQAAGFRVRATVTRQEACANLFGDVPQEIEVQARGFTPESLTEFLQRKEADLVLDATHPFAVRITLLAQEVCKRLGVPYVRYERPDWQPPEGTYQVEHFVEAAQLLPRLGERAMLTIGAKQLKHFAPLHERMTLFARILPSPLSLEQAFKAGFCGERVLCLRPPFSMEFNRALFQEYRAEILVTKASGCEGGVVEKVSAAQTLGMKVVMIRRPLVQGQNSVSSLVAAVEQCWLHLQGYNLAQRKLRETPS